MLDWLPAPASLAPEQRVYAIGDVHGCASRLAAVHEMIGADLAARPVAEASIVHLGDYIDRGPDSAAVLKRVATGGGLLPGVSIVNLLGNHEEMMLAALSTGDPETAAHWIANGGAATLRSWNLDPYGRARDWALGIPDDVLALMRRLPVSHRAGNYLFVHAGVRPLVPWRWQSRHDLLWIREPFLSWRGDFGLGGGEFAGVVIVHGHTPFLEPVVTKHRLGLDTGAVMGGALTCAVLEHDRLAFMVA